MSTSLFSVREIEVKGASGEVARDVRTALAESRGTSLVGIDLDRLGGLVEALPTVSAVSFDRAFPHTLRVRVVPERVVGVVRQGKGSYLVAASGRIVREIARTAAGDLPRIWVGRGEALRVGAPVPAGLLPAVRTVAPLHRVAFPARVAAVRVERGELHLRLRTGLDVRLGRGDDVMLKLAVAGTVLPRLAAGTTYLDVSVPERPVAGSSAAEDVEVSPFAAPVSSVTATDSVAATAPTEPTVPVPTDALAAAP